MQVLLLAFIMRKNWEFYKYIKFSFVRKNSFHFVLCDTHNTYCCVLFILDAALSGVGHLAGFPFPFIFKWVFQ